MKTTGKDQNGSKRDLNHWEEFLDSEGGGAEIISKGDFKAM